LIINPAFSNDEHSLFCSGYKIGLYSPDAETPGTEMMRQAVRSSQYWLLGARVLVAIASLFVVNGWHDRLALSGAVIGAINFAITRSLFSGVIAAISLAILATNHAETLSNGFNRLRGIPTVKKSKANKKD
jgi:hypothetical protein